MNSVIQKSTLSFLKMLSKNNDREWFNDHKGEYLQAQENAIAFADQLIGLMNRHDRIETPSGKKSLYRIYNDVRFSNDKSPYNPRFAGYLRRHKPLLRGGYYWWIKPGASRVSCGFAYPNPEDLKRIRLDIRDNSDDWRKILRAKAIKTNFGMMEGEKVATTPKGFDKDDPAIDLLRYKQFWFTRQFADKEVLASNFLNEVNKTFKSIRPFFDYMSEVLGTNLNGESIN
ncbi:MAG TPA: DUF2461 domain-containing protein [Cyclobacteriaceae bacterium]|jgi:uncharacterized protein (TIGR02453 family)|nr:DUF2461 domain-containing protein [Cyclobacteriaceae bacterium]